MSSGIDVVVTKEIPLNNVTECIKYADEKYIELMKQGEYQHILDDICKFSHLSLRNIMLVKTQNPNVEMVKNCESWNYSRRQIKEGEKGLKILLPVFEEKVLTHEDGRVETQRTSNIAGYKYGYVFDISQTKGEPIKERVVTKENASGIYEHLKERINNELLHGFDIEERGQYVDFGMHNMEAANIVINSKLKDEQKIKALISQTCQVLSKFEYRRAVKPGTFYNLEQLEGAGASYIVAKKIGMPYDSIPDPVKEMRTTKEIQDFKGNIYNMRNNANKVMVCFNEAYRDYEMEKIQQKIEAQKSIDVFNSNTQSRDYEYEGA